MSALGTRAVMRLILRCINVPYALYIHYQRIIRINPVATRLCTLSGCLPAGNVCSEIRWFPRPLYTAYAAGMCSVNPPLRKPRASQPPSCKADVRRELRVGKTGYLSGIVGLSREQSVQLFDVFTDSFVRSTFVLDLFTHIDNLRPIR